MKSVGPVYHAVYLPSVKIKSYGENFSFQPGYPFVLSAIVSFLFDLLLKSSISHFYLLSSATINNYS